MAVSGDGRPPSREGTNGRIEVRRPVVKYLDPEAFMQHRYTSGEIIRIGDQVRIGPTETGVVVGIIDDGTYINGLQKEHWDQFQTGVLVDSAAFGLTLYQDADTLEDLTRSG